MEEGPRIETCAELEPWLDPLLDGELDGAMERAVRAHLEDCADCRRLLGSIERFRRATAVALSETVATEALSGRLRAELARAGKSEERRARWPFPWALAATLVAAVLAPAWVGGELRLAASLPALPLRVDTDLYRYAGAMHYYCGIRRHVPAPPTRAAAEAKLGRYTPLLDEVPFREQGFELVDAHVCSFRQRAFAHLVLRRDERVVSVLVSPDTFGYVPPLGEAWRDRSAGLSLRRLQKGRFTFEVLSEGRYHGFVASDLEPPAERELVLAFAPGISRVLDDLAGQPAPLGRI